ncbi:MAG: HlyD family type I secretion periplasmic adaptor subunit [Minwuiales bacterium]|nr:HlyD family type I secretion periplasmic adaptor subunit [Minwuiales bacterium]
MNGGAVNTGSSEDGDTFLKDHLRPMLIVGTVTITLFFGILGGWSAVAPLARGTLASGSVSPDGSRRTVQHFEGGIIQELPVREGDRVAKGDVVAVLQQIRARSEHITYQSQLFTHLAEQGRLIAEQNSQNTIIFDPRLMADGNAPEPKEARLAQQAIFQTRRTALEKKQSVLRQRIRQHQQQIEGLHLQNESLDRQNSLIDEEIAAVEVLLQKGLERRPRLLALLRTKAQIAGTRGRNVAEIAKAREAVGEAEMEILRLESDRDDEISNALAMLRVKIAEAEQGLRRSADELERTSVTAPVDGTVMNLRFKTVGGVVKAGEAILDIVPARERLVIDARVPPLDIDAVHPGLVADVVLSAYPRRSTPTVTALVEWVSADISEDESTQETYYLARVAVENDELAKLPEAVVLYPGMPTEVMIKSGERTALDYVLEPLLSSLRRSFIES